MPRANRKPSADASPNRLKAPPARPSRTKAMRASESDEVRADILKVATHEFSETGLSGSRIDWIADRTKTSKRMIYYYFGSKEGLYRAVLADCYRRIRTIEATLDLEDKPPREALAAMVRFTFDYQLANPDFIRLVMVENIHQGQHIAQLSEIQRDAMGSIVALRDIVERGVESGVMRKDLDPIDLHMSISALCFFNVSNRHTFSKIHGFDMTSPAATAARRESVTQLILKFVAP